MCLRCFPLIFFFLVYLDASFVSLVSAKNFLFSLLYKIGLFLLFFLNSILRNGLGD